jgi:hypothetical protein
VEPATFDIKSYMITITHEPDEEEESTFASLSEPEENRHFCAFLAKIVSKGVSRVAELGAKYRSH